MKEELKKLETNAILKVGNSWGMGRRPGFGGSFITKDKEVYVYKLSYFQYPKGLEGQEEDFITKKKVLTDEEFKKVISFIEKEVLSKDYEEANIRDTTFNVTANYNGINKTVENNTELYENAKLFIDSLIEENNKIKKEIQ